MATRPPMSSLDKTFRFASQPPAGLLEKLSLYRGRYGTLHAVARFAATKVPALWPIVGPAITSGYRQRWTREGGLKLLNLGGGGNIIEGALTADLDPRADTYMDATKALPFADASIDLIFMEEFIEHISKDAGATLLAECRRVLKPGGSMRIATPDLNWLGASVINGTISCDLVNSTFYDHGHRYIYSRAEMANALTRAGFSDVQHSTYKDPETKLGFLDSHADRFHHDPLLSQYLEAVR